MPKSSIKQIVFVITTIVIVSCSNKNTTSEHKELKPIDTTSNQTTKLENLQPNLESNDSLETYLEVDSSMSQGNSIQSQTMEKSFEELKSLFIYGENAFALGTQLDTINLSFGEELFFERAYEGGCFSYPNDTVIEDKHWYKLLTKDFKELFVLPIDIAMEMKNVESENLKVVFKENCGDGMQSFNSGFIVNSNNEILKELNIEYLTKGIWVRTDSIFVYTDLWNLMYYDVQQNSISKLYKYSIRDFILNESLNSIVFITNFHNHTRDRDPMEKILGEIDLNDLSIKILYELAENVQFGFEVMDYGDFGIKVDQIEGRNCYSFLIGKSDGSNVQMQFRKVDFNGNYIGDFAN